MLLFSCLVELHWSGEKATMTCYTSWHNSGYLSRLFLFSIWNFQIKENIWRYKNIHHRLISIFKDIFTRHNSGYSHGGLSQNPAKKATWQNGKFYHQQNLTCQLGYIYGDWECAPLQNPSNEDIFSDQVTWQNGYFLQSRGLSNKDIHASKLNMQDGYQIKNNVSIVKVIKQYLYQQGIMSKEITTTRDILTRIGIQQK